MRVLGYTKKWSKLQKEVHTTFRFTRKDKDWYTGEYVQEVYHPRSKDREIINPKCLIIEKRNLFCKSITDEEAIEDGFESAIDMRNWLVKAHDLVRVKFEVIHKLTIKIVNE